MSKGQRRTVDPCIGPHLYGVQSATVSKGSVLFHLVCRKCQDEIAVASASFVIYDRIGEGSSKWKEKTK